MESQWIRVEVDARKEKDWEVGSAGWCHAREARDATVVARASMPRSARTRRTRSFYPCTSLRMALKRLHNSGARDRFGNFEKHLSGAQSRHTISAYWMRPRVRGRGLRKEYEHIMGEACSF